MQMQTQSIKTAIYLDIDSSFGAFEYITVVKKTSCVQI